LDFSESVDSLPIRKTEPLHEFQKTLEKQNQKR